MPPSMYIKDDKALREAFKRCDQLTQARYLQTAVTAGILPIHNRTLELVPRVTSNLARSLHWEVEAVREGYCEIAYGTNVDYAQRVEMGFQGTDTLGRAYNQPAKPYLRPAFDEKRQEAVEEMGDALNDILTRLIS